MVSVGLFGRGHGDHFIWPCRIASATLIKTHDVILPGRVECTSFLYEVWPLDLHYLFIKKIFH